MKNEVLNLLGSLVSFEEKFFETATGQKLRTKGLVTGVLLNLDGNHEICVKDFEDTESFFKLSEITEFKALEVDPVAFFENVKSGAIQVEI